MTREFISDCLIHRKRGWLAAFVKRKVKGWGQAMGGRDAGIRKITGYDSVHHTGVWGVKDTIVVVGKHIKRDQLRTEVVVFG
jgi:poly(A) polymerase Pap1